MTKYCLQERAKIYDAYLKYFNDNTKENWLKYIDLTYSFEYRFHKRFDPLNLVDDYDIFGYTLYRKEGEPFVPMEYRGKKLK